MAQRYQRSAQALHSEIAGDVVALHVERGECFGMADVTAEVWRLLAEPNDLDAMCAALTATYNVEDSQCRAEIGPLLDELVAAGLVERV